MSVSSPGTFDTPPKTEGVTLGDPVPWFSAPTLIGGRVDLHVNGGRWIVLMFLGDCADSAAKKALSEALSDGAHYRDDSRIFYGIFSGNPQLTEADRKFLGDITNPALNFLLDEDGAIARAYGISDGRIVVLDPLLRAVANIRLDDPNDASALLRQLLAGLPDVGKHGGIEVPPPVLILPRIFEFELCDALVDLYKRQGGADSGFLLDENGETKTLTDHRLKRRSDLILYDDEIRALLRERIVRRVVPAVELFFQFKVTRADRYMISCYDGETGGHFYRHRDNMNAGARHRRFALSINLNNDYDGGDVSFPEFGPKAYRAPVGGGVVFSTGILHEVQPVRHGQRFAFIPFLYGEEDVKLRLEMNTKLSSGDAAYEPGRDALFPETSA